MEVRCAAGKCVRRIGMHGPCNRHRPTNPVLGQHAVGERAFGRARRSPRDSVPRNTRLSTRRIFVFDHRNALTECKAQHGGGGVVTNTGQSDELVVGARQLIAIFFRHHAGAFLQSQRTARIAKPAPCGDHIGFRCCGKSTGVRPACHPIVRIRHHTTHSGVCWLITSLTSTPHGVARPKRHGKSRALASHHAPSRRKEIARRRSSFRIFLAAMTNEAEQNSQNAQYPRDRSREDVRVRVPWYRITDRTNS